MPKAWTCPNCGRLNDYYPYPTRCSQCGYLHTPEATETIGNLKKGAFVQLSPKGPMHEITGFTRNRVTLKDGQGNIQSVPNTTQVIPLEPVPAVPEEVKQLSPTELIETRAEMGVLADYTDDINFRDFLGAHTEYWSDTVYRKARAGQEFNIYRAVPIDITEIHSGAWVTQSREYAQKHLEAILRGEGHIIEGTAKANELVAINPNEFWYAPEPPAAQGDLECMICHQKFDHLISGTCESCYKKWTRGIKQ